MLRPMTCAERHALPTAGSNDPVLHGTSPGAHLGPGRLDQVLGALESPTDMILRPRALEN